MRKRPPYLIGARINNNMTIELKIMFLKYLIFGPEITTTFHAHSHHRPVLSRRDCPSYRQQPSKTQGLFTAVLASKIPAIKQSEAEAIRAQALVSFNKFRNFHFIRSSCCGGTWRQSRSFI